MWSRGAPPGWTPGPPAQRKSDKIWEPEPEDPGAAGASSTPAAGAGEAGAGEDAEEVVGPDAEVEEPVFDDAETPVRHAPAAFLAHVDGMVVDFSAEVDADLVEPEATEITYALNRQQVLANGKAVQCQSDAFGRMTVSRDTFE